MVVVMMHPTSERRATDWSAELKQEGRVSTEEKRIPTMQYLEIHPHRHYQSPKPVVIALIVVETGAY